jgi:hypothetical protein
VHRHRDVEHVPLPGLFAGEATQGAGEYLRALRLLDNPGQAG